MTPLLFTQVFATTRTRPLAPARLVRFGALFFTAYLVLDWVSFTRPFQALDITPWNAEPALAVALLMLYGQRWLPLVFLATVMTDILVRGMLLPLTSTLVTSVILAAGYSTIAYALSHQLKIAPALQDGKDVLRLAVAVVIGAAITGLFYVGWLTAQGYIPSTNFFDAYVRYWIGDSVGMTVTLPLLLMLSDSGRRGQLAVIARSRVTLMQLGLAAATLWIVFARGQPEQFKFFYLLFLPMVWISIRHGVAGAVAAVAVFQVGIVVAVVIGDQRGIQLYELQTLLMALCITGYLLGISVDERRHAADRLARSERLTAAGEMATAVAHELNQPLTALATYASSVRALMESSGIQNQTLLDTADKIRRTAIRSADVVSRFRGLLATSEPNMQPTSLSKPAWDAICSCKERAEVAGIRLVLDAPAQLPLTRLDPARIEIVFRNLIGNALDSVERTATQSRLVSVRIEYDGSSYVVATVTDTGRGVPATCAERVFEPFFSETPSGLGLGLALSRAIVESHGGRLWAEPGNHGTLRFSLPL